MPSASRAMGRDKEENHWFLRAYCGILHSHMFKEKRKKRATAGYRSKQRRRAKSPIAEPRVRRITSKELLEKISFDVISIIMSCESPDNANTYDIGYRDGVAEVRVVVDSYFRN